MVPVVRYETDGEVALIDPFLPPESEFDPHDGTGGRLHTFVDEADREPLLASLDALGELPIERVIIPHGELILANGTARIRTAVAEARG